LFLCAWRQGEHTPRICGEVISWRETQTMLVKEINDLEKKYIGFLPMPAAKQVLALIRYTRALEEKVKAQELLLSKIEPETYNDDDD